MRRLRSIAFAALAATCATVIVLPGHAQTRQAYPIKPVRLVVAFSAGGTPEETDRMLRADVETFTRVVREAGLRSK